MAKKKIYIKPKNRGSFTDYCKRNGYDGVTSSCIAKGKKSPNTATRKKAVFASNSRKWKHNK